MSYQLTGKSVRILGVKSLYQYGGCMDKELIKVLEEFNGRLDILIEVQTEIVEKLQESRETSPSLNLSIEEGVIYV